MSDLGDTHAHVHGRSLGTALRHEVAALVNDVEPGARLHATRRLRGGLWAHTHALDVDTADGERVRWVLRRYVRWEPSWGRDTECERQRAVLPVLAAAGVPAPRLLWADPDGEVLDVPALLTTFVRGRCSLPVAAAPPGPDLLAGVLADIHAVAPPPELAGTPFGDWAAEAVPARLDSWLAGCPLATDVAAAVRDGIAAARAPEGLLHGDFHAGNVLWAGTGRGLRVSAVVDWDAAGRGPRAADVSYCRADLTMALGPGAADAFAAAYEARAGALADLAWWDLLTVALVWQEFPQWLPAYAVFGVEGLTAEAMRRRLLDFAGDALRRYSVPPMSTS